MTEREIAILDGMLDLLSDESKWTKEVLARDASGAETPFDSPDACCWCLEGARLRVGGVTLSRRTIRYPLTWAAKAKGYWQVSIFNDAPETTFEDVRNLLLEVRNQFND